MSSVRLLRTLAKFKIGLELACCCSVASPHDHEGLITKIK